MEEILASIRRIISDDETNAARARPASAQQQEDETAETLEVEADDAIINDIARVLSESAPKVEDEEDILDLTAELGGTEIVEEVLLEEVVLEEVAAPVETQPAGFIPAEPRHEAAAAEAMPEPDVATPSSPLSASEEAASALERAIAALRAGHLPTSVGEFMPRVEPEPQTFAPAPELRAEPEPELAAAQEPQAEPEPEPFIEPEPEPFFKAESEPFFKAEPEPEAELVMAETVVVETVAEEPVLEETPVEETPVESASEASVVERSEPLPWQPAPVPFREPERPAARKNGSHGASKSLEDSIKDMLRPMLQKWLDENMSRVLTAALKEELGDRGQYRE
jgi:cell pole-organizing protein PopZ